MLTRMRSVLLALLAASCLLLMVVGCRYPRKDDGGNRPDSGPGPSDAGGDTSEPDASPEPDAGSALDAGPGPSDAGSDAEADASADASTDSGADTGVDAGLPFDCSGWTRDSAFDALRIGGEEVETAGTIWGFADNDAYVSIGHHLNGTMLAHWNGLSWSTETLPGSPAGNLMLWGSSSGDMWLAGYDTAAFKGYLAHKQGGIWSLDANVPNSLAFAGLWGADANTVYLVGNNRNTGDLNIWKRSGTSWVSQTLPALPDRANTFATNMWGSDASHAFVTANQRDGFGQQVASVLLSTDGASWKLLPVPTELVKVNWSQGSSPTDAFVTGLRSNGNNAVYRATGVDLPTWNVVVEGTSVQYGPLLSDSEGDALIGAWAPPNAIGGSGRLNVVQSGLALAPTVIDGDAYVPQSMWHAPGSSTYWFDHMSVFPVSAGLYTGTCR